MTARSPLLNVAVIFGGASAEHDVAVVSAQQLMDAADARRLRVIPVYMDFENRLFTGPRLRDIAAFRPRPPALTEVRFRWGDDGPELVDARGHAQPVDCALPVFHGPFGEDGRIHGMLELVGVPVTGFTASSSAIAMRKDATKTLVRSAGVNVLDHIAVSRAERGDLRAVLDAAEARLGLPVVVKPANLGSSIGVGLARSRDEIAPLLEYVLRLDDLALIEPQVRNLVEYNIAMMWRDGEVVFSAIERPKSGAELLDFREKYLSGGGGAKGALPSEGMLSLTREINPEIPAELRARIHDQARRAFVVLGARGAPRIDFMCDSATGELWFNEINPIPGSYGFFLWEAADPPRLYPQLIDHLVDEARRLSRKRFDDPVPQDAYLLPR